MWCRCNTVIPAFGQSPDVSYFPTHVQGVVTTDWQTVKTDPWNFMTDRAGVFAGGDCQMGARRVIECVAQGKLAARSMDAYLKDSSPANMAAVSERTRNGGTRAGVCVWIRWPTQADRAKVWRLPMPALRRSRATSGLSSWATRRTGATRSRALPAMRLPRRRPVRLADVRHRTWLTVTRFHDGEPQDFHDYEVDVSHSFILRDPNKCINCTQCVRVCHDVIGPNCYGMFGKGFDTIVSTPFNVSLHETDCVSCGACVQVCPTGSLMMAERELVKYDFALDRCIFCGDCVEGLPARRAGRDAEF